MTSFNGNSTLYHSTGEYQGWSRCLFGLKILVENLGIEKKKFFNGDVFQVTMEHEYKSLLKLVFVNNGEELYYKSVQFLNEK